MSPSQSILTSYNTSSKDLQFIDANRKAIEDLPGHFYRVFYEESATVYTKSEGFRAKAYYGIPGNFRDAVINHSEWSRTRSEPSPFISVFSNEESALEWMRKIIASSSHIHTNIRLAKIDVEELYQTSFGVFDTRELHKRLGFGTIPSSKDEYLCLWKIPSQAIIQIKTAETQDDINFYVRKGKRMIHVGTNPPEYMESRDSRNARPAPIARMRMGGMEIKHNPQT